MHRKTVGVLAILVASILWAIQPVIVKVAQADFIETVTTIGVVAALISFGYTAMTRQSFRIRKKEAAALLYVSIVGAVLADLLYIFVIQKIPVVNAALLGHLQPIFIVLIGFLILREDHLNVFDYVGIGFMVLSGLLVTTRSFDNLLHFRLATKWDGIMLIATVAWATTTIAARKYLNRLPAGTTNFYRYALAAVLLVPFALLTRGFFVPNGYQLALGASIGVGMILYYAGLRRLKAAQTAALELATPFFAAILGLVFLQETITALQAGGILLLFAGVYFLSKKEHT
jgi:drug/metabolite transporter (DMT)-like permease